MKRREEKKLDESLAKLKDQILLVLADYQTMKAYTLKDGEGLPLDAAYFSRGGEGLRIEVADRIIANARLILRDAK